VLLLGLLVPPLPGAAADRRSRCTDGTVPKWWSNYRAEGKEQGKLTGGGSEQRKSQGKAEEAAEASARRVLSGWLERRFYAVASWYATEHERSNEEITSQRIQALVDELVEGYLEESRRSRVQSFERCDGQFEAYSLVELYVEGVASEVAKKVIVELSGARAYRKKAVIRAVEQKLEGELMLSQEEKRAARASRAPKRPPQRVERPSGGQRPGGSRRPSRGSACANARYFHDTVWKSENLETRHVSHVKLNSDGSSGRSKTPGDFVVGAGDTWRVEGGFLILRWSNGYATERYSTDSPSCDVLRGQKASKSWQGSKSTRLSRVVEQGGGLASAAEEAGEMDAEPPTTEPARGRLPSSPPNLEGSIWAGRQWGQTSLTGKFIVRFRRDGLLGFTSKFGTYTGDKWAQSGNKVKLDITDGYAIYEGTIRGDVIEGTATNVKGKEWKWRVVRDGGVVGAHEPSPRGAVDARPSIDPSGRLAQFLGTWSERWSDVRETKNVRISFDDGELKVDMTGKWTISNVAFVNGMLSFEIKGGGSNWRFRYTLQPSTSKSLKLTVLRFHDSRTFKGEFYR